MTGRQAPRLTDLDRRLIADARRLAALRGSDAIGPEVGCSETADSGLIYACAFGVTQVLLAELAERLSGDDSTGAAAEDTRRLTAIREVLSHFDWEYHDRQLALEAIERIADGGQP